jgi:hypothetical protein
LAPAWGTDAIPLTNTEINALRASKGDWSFFEEKTKQA